MSDPRGNAWVRVRSSFRAVAIFFSVLSFAIAAAFYARFTTPY